MFRVAEIETDTYGITDRTMFRSYVERDCWDYVRSRMEVSRKSESRPARLYVLDKAGEFVSEPADVVALRRGVRVHS